ncbi:MAG: hypothetical protein AUK31_09715 [Fibrobacteres bacterium CG2_30_45_31]|nr:MAG: hypothetical protein AUK31_09715 [Fibrobacteres bacterium CG2_30_45_31]
MRRVKIGFVSELFDGPHATPKKTDSGPVFLGISTLNNGRLDLSSVEHLSEDDFPRWTKRILPSEGDVLFSYETRIGQVALMQAGLRCCLGRRMALLRPKSDELSSQYFVYYYLSPSFQEYLRCRTIHGCTVDRISLTDFPEFEISIPPIFVQKSIAHILGSLDDKIALNRRINQTLEAMAQAQFQSWFVDFDPVKAKQQILEAGGTAREAELAAMQIISGKDPRQLKTFQQTQPQQYAELEHTAKLFPNRLVESELGLVPEGWEYQRAEKIADIGIGKTPPRNESQWFSTNSNDIKWASIRDMGESGAYIIDTHERLTTASVEKFNVRRIPQNTLLLSFKMTVGRVAITTEEMLSNEAIAHFNLNAKSSIGTEYLYLYLKSFDYNSLGSTSSIATAVNSKTIKEMTVLVPTSSVSARFEMGMKPLFDEMLVRQKENSSLIETRDSLLPKLLSGEIDVSSLEINS